MKRIFTAAVLFLAMAAVSFLGTAQATPQVATYDAGTVNKIASPSTGHELTTVSDDGNFVVITIKNVRLTPVGVDTKGKNLEATDTIELYSGIMDAAGIKAPFAVAKVVNGTATFRIPNSAKAVGVPVVDHIWGRYGSGKALVHDPADPWVCYKTHADGSPDLNTLAIGLVMYPNKATVPLMSLGNGKLDQGKHPELK